jgi:hypothetical protein
VKCVVVSVVAAGAVAAARRGGGGGGTVVVIPGSASRTRCLGGHTLCVLRERAPLAVDTKTLRIAKNRPVAVVFVVVFVVFDSIVEEAIFEV